MSDLAYVDGNVMDLDKALIGMADRAHLLGDGLFETMQARKNRIAFLDAHRARFTQGLQVLGYPVSITKDFDMAVTTLLEHADNRHSLRIQASLGDLVHFSAGAQPRVTGILRVAPDQPPNTSVRLVTSAVTKSTKDPLVGVKHCSYGPHAYARRHAMIAGANDALLLNEFGRVAEATTSNVLAWKDDTLYAPGPGEGALGGVTRQQVLAWAAGEGVTIQEQLPLEVLKSCDEAWLSSSIVGIIPIASVDDVKLGAPKRFDAADAMLESKHA